MHNFKTKYRHIDISHKSSKKLFSIIFVISILVLIIGLPKHIIRNDAA